MRDLVAGGGVRCMWMRGGTSKGGFFLADDLPAEPRERDALLLAVMGSPDPRQIDRMGGADPLTSKVAVVKRSDRPDADVDYLFLQVFVDQAIVTDVQTCGNMLAGVGPLAIERGLVAGRAGTTDVAIHDVNTAQVAVACVSTPSGVPTYSGDAAIDGVPGVHAPIPIAFRDIAGSSCGALLPTGNPVDTVAGVAATLIDNGMPVVVLLAADMGIAGDETRAALEADEGLKARLEAVRLAAGPMMNLGNVAEKSVPKMTMVSSPRFGGTVSTRTFIPHRCHASIGVLGAVSVATACLLPAGLAAGLAVVPGGSSKQLDIEHPSGRASVVLDVDEAGGITRAAILRTARKLFDGTIFPAADSS